MRTINFNANEYKNVLVSEYGAIHCIIDEIEGIIPSNRVLVDNFYQEEYDEDTYWCQSNGSFIVMAKEPKHIVEYMNSLSALYEESSVLMGKLKDEYVYYAE